MNQKTALYLALGLTTFILVAIGSVALAWPALQQRPDAEAQPVVQTIPTLPAAVQLPEPSSSQDDPAAAEVQSLLNAIEAREAAYRAQIEQANQQLQEAYERLQALEAQNQLLLEREQIYQQRLQESAQVIEAMTAQPASVTTASYEDGDYDEDDDDHREAYHEEARPRHGDHDDDHEDDD